jgi:hypothetical protein
MVSSLRFWTIYMGDSNKSEKLNIELDIYLALAQPRSKRKADQRSFNLSSSPIMSQVNLNWDPVLLVSQALAVRSACA